MIGWKSKTRCRINEDDHIEYSHNPTGSVYKESDLIELSEITRGTDTIVLSDEVYEHIIFEENTHQSVLRFSDLFDRSLVVAFVKHFTLRAGSWLYCRSKIINDRIYKGPPIQCLLL